MEEFEDPTATVINVKQNNLMGSFLGVGLSAWYHKRRFKKETLNQFERQYANFSFSFLGILSRKRTARYQTLQQNNDLEQQRVDLATADGSAPVGSSNASGDGDSVVLQEVAPEPVNPNK